MKREITLAAMNALNANMYIKQINILHYMDVKMFVLLCKQLRIYFFVYIEEENQAKRTTMTRRLSVADDKDRVALICKNVLPRFNNSQKLRQHFSKFGEVARVFPKPEKGMATIHFKTHVSH